MTSRLNPSSPSLETSQDANDLDTILPKFEVLFAYTGMLKVPLCTGTQEIKPQERPRQKS